MAWMFLVGKNLNWVWKISPFLRGSQCWQICSRLFRRLPGFSLWSFLADSLKLIKNKSEHMSNAAWKCTQRSCSESHESGLEQPTSYSANVCTLTITAIHSEIFCVSSPSPSPTPAVTTTGPEITSITETASLLWKLPHTEAVCQIDLFLCM